MHTCMYVYVCVCICLYGEGLSGSYLCRICVVERSQQCVSYGSPISLGAIAAQGNELGPAGAAALRPALVELTQLTHLSVSRTCGRACGVSERVCLERQLSRF